MGIPSQEATLQFSELPSQWGSAIKGGNFSSPLVTNSCFNPIALSTAKTIWSFGCTECNRIKIALISGGLSSGKENGKSQKVFVLV